MTVEELTNKHIVDTVEALKKDAGFMALSRAQKWGKLTLELGLTEVTLRRKFEKLNISLDF